MDSCRDELTVQAYLKKYRKVYPGDPIYIPELGQETDAGQESGDAGSVNAELSGSSW